jgi:antitoxin component of MazEF toxin-antitoxin module
MKVKVRRVGNSMAVTIPADLVEELGITRDTEMDVSARGDAILLEPVTTRWERLVAAVRLEAAGRGLTEQDVDEAVAELRGRPAS